MAKKYRVGDQSFTVESQNEEQFKNEFGEEASLISIDKKSNIETTGGPVSKTEFERDPALKAIHGSYNKYLSTFGEQIETEDGLPQESEVESKVIPSTRLETEEEKEARIKKQELVPLSFEVFKQKEQKRVEKATAYNKDYIADYSDYKEYLKAFNNKEPYLAAGKIKTDYVPEQIIEVDPPQQIPKITQPTVEIDSTTLKKGVKVITDENGDEKIYFTEDIKQDGDPYYFQIDNILQEESTTELFKYTIDSNSINFPGSRIVDRPLKLDFQDNDKTDELGKTSSSHITWILPNGKNGVIKVANIQDGRPISRNKEEWEKEQIEKSKTHLREYENWYNEETVYGGQKIKNKNHPFITSGTADMFGRRSSKFQSGPRFSLYDSTDRDSINRSLKGTGWTIDTTSKQYLKGKYDLKKDGETILQGATPEDIQSYSWDNFTNEEYSVIIENNHADLTNYIKNIKTHQEKRRSNVDRFNNNHYENMLHDQGEVFKHVLWEAEERGASKSGINRINTLINLETNKIDENGDKIKGWQKEVYNELSNYIDQAEPSPTNLFYNNLNLNEEDRDILKNIIKDKIGYSTNDIDRLKDKIVNEDISLWIESEYEKQPGYVGITAAIERSGNNYKLDVAKYNEKIKTLNYLNDQFHVKHKIVGEKLFSEMQKNKIGVEFFGDDITNQYAVVDAPMKYQPLLRKSLPDIKTRDYYQKKINDYLDSAKTQYKEFELGKKDITNNYNEITRNYQDLQDENGETIDFNFYNKIVNKEFDDISVFFNDVHDATADVFLSIPAMFGSKGSLKELDKLDSSKQAFETALTYKQAKDLGKMWTYSNRTMATQLPNVTLTIGGAYLGVPLPAIAFGLYGTQAGGRKKHEMYTLNEQAKKADLDLANLEKYKNQITSDTYRYHKIDLEKKKAMGNISRWQMEGAALLSFGIEGTIASAFGTIPNAANIIKGFKPVKSIKDLIMLSNTKAALNGLGRFSLAVGSENIEELAIFAGDNVSSNLIYGRDMNWSGWKDVTYSATLLGTTMNAAPIAYQTITMQMMSNRIKTEIDKEVNKLKDLDVVLENLSIDKKDDINRARVQKEYESIISNLSTISHGIEVDALLVGADGMRSLIENSIDLAQLHKEAGVNPKDSKSKQNQTIEKYLSTLGESEAKDFNSRLNLINKSEAEIRNSAEQRLQENILDEGGIVEQLYGRKGKKIADKLLTKDPSFADLSPRDQLTVINQHFKRNFKNQLIKEAQNTPEIKNRVEEIIYGTRFEDSGRKKRKKKEEKELYEYFASVINTKRVTALQTYRGGERAAKAIKDKYGSLKNLNIVEFKTEKQLVEFLQDNNVEAGKIADMVEGFKNGTNKGFIIDDQYIVTDKKAAQKNIDNGDLLQGTMWMHEVGHALDAVTMKKGEINQYAKNLSDYLLKNETLGPIHLGAIHRATELGEYDVEKTFDQQSDKFKDEYIKYVGDILMASGTDSKMMEEARKSGASIANIVRGTMIGGKILGKDFTLKTPQDAMRYLVDYIDSFKKGDLSKLSERKMEVFEAMAKGGSVTTPKATIKESRDVTNSVNELGDAGWTKKDWNDTGADFALETMINEGMLDRLIASKLKVPMGFEDTVEFTKKVYAELAGHIKNFNPEQQGESGLFGWVNAQIGNKAGNVYNREYKIEQRTQDITATTEEGAPLIQIEADTDVEMEFIDNIGLNQEQQEKRSQLKQDLGLNENTTKKVQNAVIKTFGTILPDVESKDFKSALEKSFRTELKKTIQDMIGSRADYDNFLEKNFEAVFNQLPVETLIQMERNVKPENRIFTKSRRITKPKEVDRLISEGLLPKDTNRLSGPQLHTKNDFPGNIKVLAFFRGVDMENQLGYKVGASTLGTRKDVLASRIGEELAFDATMEVIQNPDIQEKRTGILELQGKEQLENELAIIGKQIDRSPNIKFSQNYQTVKNELKLSDADLVSIIKTKSMSEIEADYPLLHDAVVESFEKKNGPQDFENKGFLKIISEGSTELAKLVKDKVHITRRKEGDDYVFEVKKLEEHFNNYSLGLLDFMPSFMGVRENSVKGSYKFLENAIFKGSSSRGNAGPTLDIRQGNRTVFRDKLTNNMGKLLTPETKKLWNEFDKVKDKLELAESTFDMPDTLLRDLRSIQASDLSAKQKIKEAKKLFKKGSLDAAQKLFKAYNSSIQDWVNHQVDNGIMTREEAIAYVVRDKQKNTNFTKGERALAAFTSVYFTDGAQDVSKKDFKGEHVKDSATMSAETALSIYNNTFNQDADNILNGFEQAYIPKKFANEMDKLGGANSPLRNRRFILNPEIGKQVFDLATGKSMYELELEKYSLEESKRLKEMFDNSEKMKPIVKASTNKSNYLKTGKVQGLSAFDFDETLIIDGENFVTAKDPITEAEIKISSGDWPTRGPELQEQGYEFDFSDFVNVKGGIEGPLFQKLKNRIEKYGSENNFILTARPQAADIAIHGWLKSKGVNIPLENITGLGDSTGEAKANWIMGKFAEGYNDMYFVDDALPNVEAVKDVLEQLDIKGSSVQAKIMFSRNVDKDFNDILERTKGVGKEKTFSQAEARVRGKGKGRFDFFVPPSAEDFKGLLYKFLGTGKQGDDDLKFFKETLLDPFAKANRAHNVYKQTMADEYRGLRKNYSNVRKNLNKLVGDTNFTNDSAIRVYLWDKAGFDIPGISNQAKNKLIKHINSSVELTSFAESLSMISRRPEGYIEPSKFWMVQSIATDLNSITSRVGRSEFLSEWIENKNQVFSEQNLNKIEATYGTSYRDALENMLYRMETGTNRTTGKDKTVNKFVDWINGSVGAVMFFNMRSAALQTISTVNFINWSDNNMFAAGKAFANQPQYWKDFAHIFNSPMLKQRRAGLQIDVSASELTKAFSEGKSKPEAILAYLLEIGFTPTKIADSFAISAGGSTFYRNRTNKYIKEGMSKAKAETQAMLDFQEISEETQQSSRPDLISQQQAGPLGRLILAWQNTPMQMTRLTKKALSDMVNNRGDMKSNISKVLYYGAIQNVIFGSLQSGLAFTMWGDDEEDIKNKQVRVANGALDTILRGTGIYGAMASTLKNTIIQWDIQRRKGYGRQDWSKVALDAVSLSPPIGSKLRKIMNSIKTYEYNKDVIKEMDVRIDNPAWSVGANIVEALTNLPLARAINKANNLEEAITGNHATWQRVALAMGWNKWDVGVKDEELEEARAKVKEEKKQEKKLEAERKKEEKKKEKEEIKKQKEKEKEEKGIKKVRCSAIKSNGKRCNMMVETKAKTAKCMYHKTYTEEEEKKGSDRDNDGIREFRCTATKSNGKRCKNRTENKNKKCYAHQ